MIGGDQNRALSGDVLPALRAHPEVEVEEGLQDGAHEPVDDRYRAALAGDLMCALGIHSVGREHTPCRMARLHAFGAGAGLS